MERFEHGGNIYAHQGVLDFSANLNPLGAPSSAKDALEASIERIEAYPDPNSTELVAAIAAFEGVDESWVVPGAGATDLISRVCLAQARRARGGHAVVCAPCYSGYEQALEQAGIAIVRHVLDEQDGFNVTERILRDIGPNTSLVFLANPNNPTGLCLDPSLLETVLEHARNRDILVVLDECFVDLTEQPGSNSLLARYRNLVLVKALTKTFALAGLRIGYSLCSSDKINEALRSFGHMWAVSTPAQLAGVAALGERAYVEQAKQLVAAERKRLSQALGETGFTVVPGQANYLFFRDTRPQDGKAPTTPLDKALLERGILVRTCSNYQGITGRWYRIAVRTPEENAQLIAALKEV